MWRPKVLTLAVMLALAGGAVWADDLTGSSRFLCAAVQATACVEEGECGTDVPWNLNIPLFIVVDLEAGQLSTTAASGENRATSIQHLTRSEGVIVFHGFEMGRAFSWVISEDTGRTTIALAAAGASVTVFGSCTPTPGGSAPAGN